MGQEELEQQLEGAYVTIEALKQRIVALNFEIVDMMSQRIAEEQQQQNPFAGMEVVSDEDGSEDEITEVES